MGEKKNPLTRQKRDLDDKSKSTLRVGLFVSVRLRAPVSGFRPTDIEAVRKGQNYFYFHINPTSEDFKPRIITVFHAQFTVTLRVGEMRKRQKRRLRN